MTEKRKAPAKAGNKQTSTRFKKGQSGNPKGRPEGSRNRATLAMEVLLDGEAEALTRKAVDMALEGDAQALRLCLERLLPPRKDRPVKFDLPKLETTADAIKASAAIAEAVADGDLTPTEAEIMGRLVTAFVQALEVHDHEERIKRIEEAREL